MEESIYSDSVRSRLVLAGLAELKQHGATDFSLRRVAKEAGVSCAAPYRHFKDKDELIGSVIRYVLEGWTLLAGQITDIFSHDPGALLVELAVAGLRFWIANGNFRTVITASSILAEGQKGALLDFDLPIVRAAETYAEHTGAAANDLSFKVLSMLYGTIILVDGGFENADIAADNLKRAVRSEL